MLQFELSERHVYSCVSSECILYQQREYSCQQRVYSYASSVSIAMPAA